MKELITLTELASALQLEPETVSELVKEKRIPFEKVSNKLLKVRGTIVEDSKRLLKVKEVAEILSVDQRTVYSWTKLGILPSIRLGRTIRFDPEIMKQLTAGNEKWREYERS